MKPDLKSTLLDIQHWTTKLSLPTLKKIETLQKELMEHVYEYQTTITEGGIPRKAIADKLGYSSKNAITRRLGQLVQLNYLQHQVKNTRYGVIPLSAFKIPVYMESNWEKPITEAIVDTRMFSKPPHYAIQLTKQHGQLGGTGTMVILHKGLYAPKGGTRAVISRNLEINQCTEDSRLRGVFDSIVVGTITPLKQG
ncbi:hypothetical protein OH460_07610 [Vibrio sp. Makdt]|uniref:hypothetical protein n=1 Tax=Vibrio sp. Makdt TaxID=2998828 RepID=UPI0022CD8F52|nr:hypothetical protein [Vibrio sp. Makdt]MDA0152164.1 hypothetical protein [Vibrio sp. Makdt]